MVVRLEGTNVEQGKKILEESGLRFQSASSMQEAADKVVPLATQGQ
jgi:succinyl-CoA synthetase beta subunit